MSSVSAWPLMLGKDGHQRAHQAASAWCHDGGQTAGFSAVHSGPLTTRQPRDLGERTLANPCGHTSAALAVWEAGVRVPSAPPI